MPVLAVPAFALTWWLAAFLVGRDPRRAAGWRAGGALVAYALGIAAWTIAPGSAVAQVLFCLPALFWAATAIALIPAAAAERRKVDLGALVLGVLFLLMISLMPAPGRLVVVAPLIGGLVLLWQSPRRPEPRLLPAGLTVAALLYAAGLAALLLPSDRAASGLVIAAIGVDVLVLGYLVAVAEAVDAGERLRPDLSRSLVGAVFALLLAGGPATVTIVLAPGVAVLQFVLLAAVMTVAALSGPVRRLIDHVAFRPDDRLRADRAALLELADTLPRRRERHLLASTGETDFTRFTRRALESYGDPSRLARSPLIDLPAATRHREGLRGVLADAVEALRPPGPFATSEEWRHYHALRMYHLLGVRPHARRQRLGGLDGLDRDERQAAEWLRQYVPDRVLRRWLDEGTRLVATRLREDMARSANTDRRRPTTTRST